ncbi:TIGR01666 family membrane protein [Flavobacterium succinicans]|uniref:TIGR01666 family membrane protein n=2 Tax=Flavobacterium succinicans TaxID=29536 RepID=A0A1I4UH02_9FLAO|nr:TIGR01666 family membrane protein [Flavobacterium succinicans]
MAISLDFTKISISILITINKPYTIPIFEVHCIPMIEKIINFTQTIHFTNALKVTTATVIPVLLFTYLGHFDIGFSIALGAFFTYPSDIPSSLSHKIKGLLVTASLIALVNLLVNILYPYKFVFYPIFGILIFLFSMISVYGQRATAVSFSCLLSLCLAFAHLHTGWEMLGYAALIFTGGLFYLLVSLLFHYLNPFRFIELQLVSCIELTAKYLKLRADLWKKEADRKSIIEKQLVLQVELNTVHETIRSVLIGNQSLYSDTAQNRKLLIVFINLVEILELALATSFDHKTLHEKFDVQPEIIKSYATLATNLKKTLKQLSNNIPKSSQYRSKHSLEVDLKNFESTILEYQNNIKDSGSHEGISMLTNMLHYAERQVEKIKTIERAFDLKIKEKHPEINRKELQKFLTPQYYPLSTFINNLSFSSTLFRHSLRLSVALLFGFCVGSFLPFQNVFWILLTIIVIMRPGYGLTKVRSYQRTIGTILGGFIAFGCLYFIDNTVVRSMMAIVCILLGMAFTNISYKTSATFVTMYVVFLYSILTPEISNVIELRIIDTLIGAIIAYTFNHFFWPSWEFINTPKHIEKAIQANKNYLNQIALFYNEKGTVSTVYKVARKNAFVEIGNLMASFQRMSQEPKSKQVKIAQVYKLAVLNHTLLSSIASMGTYIQSHKTTAASIAFNSVMTTVIQNLEEALQLLNPNTPTEQVTVSNTEKASGFLELMKIKMNEISAKEASTTLDHSIQMQEAQLIIEQLVWLTNLSENILKNTKILLEN